MTDNVNFTGKIESSSFNAPVGNIELDFSDAIEAAIAKEFLMLLSLAEKTNGLASNKVEYDQGEFISFVEGLTGHNYGDDLLAARDDYIKSLQNT